MEKSCCFFRGLPDGPVKDLFCHKLRQADEGEPPEIRLAGVVYALGILLPPQTLQGRHHIVKVALQLVFVHLAHFDGVGHSVKQFQGLLVSAALLIGVTLAPHRQKVHGGHRDDAGFLRGQIEFLISFL